MANNGQLIGKFIKTGAKFVERCKTPIATTILLFLFVLVSFLIILDLQELPSDGLLEQPARTVLKSLQGLPTNYWLYFSIIELMVVYLGWHWHLHIRLLKEIDNQENPTPNPEGNKNLTHRDWWVIRKLRERALGLRMRADTMLASVIALLFGGVYLLLFVVPRIAESDRSLIEQTEQAAFQERFGATLQLIREGGILVQGE